MRVGFKASVVFSCTPQIGFQSAQFSQLINAETQNEFKTTV